MATSKKPLVKPEIDGDLYDLFRTWVAQDPDRWEAALWIDADGSCRVLSSDGHVIGTWNLKSDAVTWFEAVIK